MLSMNNKIKFSFLGMVFNVKGYVTSYNNETEFNVGCVGGGMMVKQYIKQKYPNEDFKVWVKSEKYSGGSSLRINLSNRDGSKVFNEIYEDVETFGNTLQWGNFNGMIDLYEPKEEDRLTNDGLKISFYTSYVFTYNEPPFGSKEFELNEQLKLESV
jgi:hypothetical protein|tara:strand:- start:433 stop:903 length:471 start_codon:yes stop_codon:yes gene_type:complete